MPHAGILVLRAHAPVLGICASHSKVVRLSHSSITKILIHIY